MYLSNFESPTSKNLSGSSHVSGLKTLNTPKGAGAQMMPLNYLNKILRQGVVFITRN
jgi:hypothetical protein